jgi:selenocysteine lyase/cysteine desulfurase
MILPSQRHLFSLPRELCYLNAAYMTPQPRSVEEAGLAATSRRARPWQLSEGDFFADVERARERFARLIGATVDDIAIVPAASYGIAVAARNLDLKPGEKIITLHEQFPSHVYSWQRLAGEKDAAIETVLLGEEGGWTEAVLAKMEEHGEAVAAVALPNYHWANGAPVDLALVGAAARGVGAELILDTSQSMGAAPFDLAAVDPDYMVAAGYKWLFCPYGISFLYVAPRHQGGVPLEENWINRLGSEDFAGLVDYQPAYQPGARRFDVGQRAYFSMMPAAAAALEQMLDWGVANIGETLAAHNRALAEIFAEAGYAVPGEEARGPHLMGVTAPGPLDAGFTARLKEQGISVSVRGSSLRVAPHVYNDEEDFARLKAALFS